MEVKIFGGDGKEKDENHKSMLKKNIQKKQFTFSENFQLSNII